MRIVSALLLTIACSYVKAQDANNPTKKPTRNPTRNPSRNPTRNPTRRPTKQPTQQPTKQPTRNPTRRPTTSRPTRTPTRTPTKNPTRNPTIKPTVNPTKFPTLFPTGSDFSVNTFTTSAGATTNVDAQSTESLTIFCTAGEVNRVQVIEKDRESVSCITNDSGAILRISDGNTLVESITLFTEGSCGGRTGVPNFCGFTGEGEEIDLSLSTLNPTRNPTTSPSNRPSHRPTEGATIPPTDPVTNTDTSSSTMNDTVIRNPTRNPTRKPTKTPTNNPTSHPTRKPTRTPTNNPTSPPTRNPTKTPTRNPTKQPTTPSPTTTGVGDDRRFNINKYIEDNQAFLVYKKQFLEVSVDTYEYAPSRQLQPQFVTTVYWLGPPQIQRDSSGRIDTVVARALEYVDNSDSVNVISDGIEKFNPEGFATVWNNVLEYYDSVITDFDKQGKDRSICRFNEAGFPEAAIVEFEPRDFVGAVKATWEFQTFGVPELEQLEHDLGRKATPESFPDAYAEAVANSKRPSKRPSKNPKKTKKPKTTKTTKKPKKTD